MKIALVGATGLVGSEMIKVLEERMSAVNFTFVPVASEKSVGKKIAFNNNEYSIVSLNEAVAQKPEIAIFSAGGEISKEWAPKFANVGTFVIDNSSAWRMEPNIPLVVPEINSSTINTNTKIIANPNCSTIQLVVALADVHKLYGLQRIVVSTYQSVTGTGVKALQQLKEEALGNQEVEKAYKYKIFENCIPHCDTFTPNGYTKEELKVINETQKILNDNSIKITCTAVRVPVIGGHSESVNITLKNEVNLESLTKTIANTAGVELQNNTDEFLYPMPLYSKGKDSVFVGRIREDFSLQNSFNLWIVADNLRKGAATNAIQIAQHLIEQKLV
jgi:aspartate-semialdehyde dehydrogenase